MGCVNISSKEFKKLAKDNNLDSGTMELIVHKYWLEKGADDLFPTNVYVQAQLGNTQYKESGKAIRDLWELKYSTPQEFSSINEMLEVREKALRFFPESAIVYHKNAQGNYVLIVKQPVRSINQRAGHSMEGGALRHVRPIKLDVEEKKSYGIDKVEELFNRFNSDKTTKYLADKVFTIAKELGISVSFSNNMSLWTIGGHTSNNTITFNKKYLERGFSHDQKASVILSKVIEAITEHALTDDAQEVKSQKPGAIRKFREEMNKIFQEVRNREELAGERGVTSLREFVSSLANPVFREKLKKIEKKSFWEKVKNAIRKLLNISASSNYYTRSMNALEKALDSFDIDSYMEYNGMKETLQQNFREKNWQYRVMSENEMRNALKEDDRLSYNQRDLLDQMDEQDLRETMERLEQEQEDYDLIANQIGEEPIKRAEGETQFAIENGKRKTRFFTFKKGKDGDRITVNAPFQPNNEQIDALNRMADFVDSTDPKRKVMTLSGYAGTGKTSIMEMLAQRMQKKRQPVLFCASTNKAAQVLQGKLSKYHIQSTTLNTVFGIRVEENPKKEYNQRDLVTILDEIDIAEGTTVIIDEASMIGKANFDIINKIAKEMRLKIIYVGDPAQLPPVKETQISPVFRNTQGEIITLRSVMRTGDNAILKEATDLRSDKELSRVSSFNTEGQGVAFVPVNDTASKDAIIRHYVRGLERNPDYFRILAFHNRVVAEYNTAVRKLLGYNDYIPRVGEPLMGYSNWGYQGKATALTEKYRVINSGSYKVVEVREAEMLDTPYINGVKYKIEAVPIVIEDSLGNQQIVNYIDIKGNAANREVATILARRKIELWRAINSIKGNGPIEKSQKAPYLREKNEIEDFLFINDDIVTSNGNTLQQKVIDFGYALTIHKSQGSTFENVLIDDADIESATFNEGESVELGLNNATPEQTVDIKRQLRYVAVTRASSTASIISNEVKKADSPLNHLQHSQESGTTQEPEQNPDTLMQEHADRMTSNEVWDYVSKIKGTQGPIAIPYTPTGKPRQIFTVRDGHVYNKDNKEVGEGRDRNKILANKDIKDEKAVVVEYRDKKYVVNSDKVITSVITGSVMKWPDNNGDRRAIIAEAERKFRDMIDYIQNDITTQLSDHLTATGYKVHGRKDFPEYIQSHSADKLMQALQERWEIQAIRDKAIADGTFMKAPNGRPSNLNERQWLQVRTKAFKEWFGNWMNDPANASKVVDENGEPLVVYHRTPNKFTTFKNTEHGGYWFSKEKEYYGPIDNSTYTVIDSRTLNGIEVENFDSFTLQLSERAVKTTSKETIEALINDGLITKDKWRGVEFYRLTELGNEKVQEETHEEPNEHVVAAFLNVRNPNIINHSQFLRAVDGDAATEYLKHTKFDGWITQYVHEPEFSGDTHEESIAFVMANNPNQIKSATDNNGDFSRWDDDIQAMMIGEKGARNLDAAEEATTRMDNLSIANEMEKAGKDALTIKIATGWERGADGKWRYEMSDVDIKQDWFDKVNKLGREQRKNLVFSIDDILLDNAALKAIKQYSRISSLKITAHNDILLDFLNSTRGYYDSSTNTIMLNFEPVFLGDPVTIEDIRSTLAHEIQHLIQKEEGFATGGNTNMFDKHPEILKLNKQKEDLKALEEELFIAENAMHKALIETKNSMWDKTEEYKKWEYEQDHIKEINRERSKINDEIRKKKNALYNKQAQERKDFEKSKPNVIVRKFFPSKYKDWLFEQVKLLIRQANELEQFDKENPEQKFVRYGIFNGAHFNFEKYSEEEKRAIRDEVSKIRSKWEKESEKYENLRKQQEELQDKISSLEYKLYRSIAGEVESRAVSARMNLTEEERRNSLFTDDMYKDVAKEDLIFLQNNLGKSAFSISDRVNEEGTLPLSTILTESQYRDMVEELQLSEEKASEFVLNFMERVLNVNPRYKVDEKGSDFRYKVLGTNNAPSGTKQESFDALTKKIFGFDAYIHINQGREQFVEVIDEVLSNWADRLEERINDPGISLDRSYKDKQQALNDIKLLQRFIDHSLSFDSFTEAETERIKYLLPTRKTKQSAGYKIQKTKGTIEGINAGIERLRYARYARILAAKNRIVALNTIPNLKELVKQRLLAEYDSRTVKNPERFESSRPLYNAIRKASASKDKNSEGLFNSTEKEEISIAQLKKIILGQNPEYETLVDLFTAANPNLKIVVGGKAPQILGGKEAGKFAPKTNTLHLSNDADIFTAIHEWAHAATYYGIVGRDADDENSKAFEEQINSFMDYIREYIEKEQMNPGLFKKVTIMRVDMPALIYGFTNASEFIAETFGNPVFQDLLTLIPAMDSKKFKTLLHQFWDSVINFLKKLFNKKSISSNALEQAKTLGFTAMLLQQEHINAIYAQLEEIKKREQVDREENAQHSIQYPSEGLSSTSKEERRASNRKLRELESDGNNLSFYKTPEGEVYGFVTPEGEIYLDETVIKPQHPIHEYTHLWDRMLQEKHKRLWKKGVALMRETPLWNQILNDSNYGGKWRAQGKTGEELKNLIASEVHARLVGTEGSKILNQLAQEKGHKGIVDKLKQWILEAWRTLKATFSTWSDEEIAKLTLDDFNHMTIRDFADGLNMKDAPYMDVSDAPRESSSEKRLETVNKMRQYFKWQRNHFTFNKKNHTYYYNNTPIDYSVTEYRDTIYGKKTFAEDYSHSLAIGNDVDAITRDYFLGVDAMSKEYPNLNTERKQALLNDLRRLKNYLDTAREFTTVGPDGRRIPNYQVITSEFPIAGRIMTANGEKTVAGTIDMLIVDGEGNLHIFDMKAKKNPITATFRGKPTDDRRNYTFQLNAYRQLLESIFPEFQGKIKDLRLIWFDTSYPQQGRDARFVTSDYGVVTVSEDGKTKMPLSEYSKWKTPSLKENVNDSLIPLEITSPLRDARPLEGMDLQENRPYNKQQPTQPLVITTTSNTANKAREIKGVDTLRHPDADGMHFGNPFSYQAYAGVRKVVGNVREAVIAFEQWLRGEQYQEIEPERRQWILDQINSGALDGKPIVYYTNEVPDNSYGRKYYDYNEAPNHAHILQKLILEHQQGKVIGQQVSEQQPGSGTVKEKPNQQEGLVVDRTEEFYTKSSTNDYVNDLVNIEGIDRSLIKVEHVPATDSTDDYWTVTVYKKQAKQAPVQSPVQPASQQGSETKINIYAGTNENADLSNFAVRPFTSPEGLEIESVEQGFHYGKFVMLKNAIASAYTARDAAYTDIIGQINALQSSLMNTKRANFQSDVSYGARLKSIGNTRLKAKDSDIQYIIDNFFSKTKVEGMPNWENDKTASNIMKALIKSSFAQNPQARQRLLDTGNATFTHTQDKSKWGTEFPKLLKEVRDELRASTAGQQSPIQRAPGTSITKSEGGYPQRTKENADWSDITLALALDFNTAGEKLTKRVAGNKYISAHPTGDLNIVVNELYNQIVTASLPTKNIKLNVAGNGIYSLISDDIDAAFTSQADVNNAVTEIIRGLQQKGITIAEVRSGGQTGVDEAGIIAAQRLGIPSSVHAPSDYAFRTADGKDVRGNKEAFEKRFLQSPTGTSDNQNKDLNKISKYGNDFRRVQEAVRKSGKGVQSTSPDGHLSEDARRRLARVLGNELRSRHSALLNGPGVDLTGKGNKFTMHKEVNPQLFHDFFEVVRYYTPNGELVDLHDDYTDCKCYLSDDGTCGFAIEPNGNLVSVFNLGVTRGFLYAIKDLAISEGATHLDAYASTTQNLRLIYEKVLGAKAASSMDYNMEYDHDNIANNHGNPQVVFMVLGNAANREVVEKHFNKDQYNEAVEYQQKYVRAKNNLVITPAKALDKKAATKGSISNKFIGFADGIAGSSTAEYARQASDKANMGVYSSADTVFVSIPGLRGAKEVRTAQQDRTIDEALKALRSGATLITDNRAYVENSAYNEGEKRLARALADAGAVYSERKENNQILGVWKLETFNGDDYFNTPSSSEVITEDVYKAWHSTPYRSNKTRRIYLRGKKNKGYFEVVRDIPESDNMYSVHFKPTDKNNPKAFTDSEKSILFQALADVIPEGAQVSTHGEISRGGKAGLERLEALGFVETSMRVVKMKETGEDTIIPVYTKDTSITEKRISLPNYEAKNGFDEKTLVDAEWKISRLKELDKQLTDDNTEEHEKIINQMNEILEADNEEELENPTKQSEKTKKTLAEFDKVAQQLNNLLDSNIISASEIRHVAEQLVNQFSDIITEIQKEEGKAQSYFEDLNTDLDFQKATRREIIDAITIERLITRVKSMFDPQVQRWKSRKIIKQARLILDNWDAIMMLASDTFAMNEGFGITKNYGNEGKYETTDDAKVEIGVDDFNDNKNDVDAMRETEDEQEHWQIENRTIDVLNSMSALVRQAIRECYIIDENRDYVKSQWNIRERVNARSAVNSILRWTQGARDLGEMVNMLIQQESKHPWVHQLITRLSDPSGNNADFQSQFFGVFRKDFQLYSVVTYDEKAKKYVSKPVNRDPVMAEALGALSAQVNAQTHALFTPNGIRDSYLGTKEDAKTSADFTLYKAYIQLGEVHQKLKDGEPLDEGMRKKAIESLFIAYRILGYQVTEDLVTESLNAESISDRYVALGFIVTKLSGEAKREDEGGKDAIKEYKPFAYSNDNNPGTKFSIRSEMIKFLKPVTELLQVSAVNAFYDSGKMYQSYVTPSYMTKLLNKFKLGDEEFGKFIDQEYKFSQWYNNGMWRNEMLRLLAEDKSTRDMFEHKVQLNFNKRNYMRNMNDAEYTLSLIAEYFTERRSGKESMVPAWYKMPMQSNKPSSEFIRFWSWRGYSYKDDIATYLRDTFDQELDRIKTVMMRNISEGEEGYIKNFDKNGRKFCFLPFFNAYLEKGDVSKRDLLGAAGEETQQERNNNFAKALQKLIKGEEELTSKEEALLEKAPVEIIKNFMERRTNEILIKWEQQGIFEEAKKIENVGKTPKEIKENLENFIWNDYFMSKNILQLTVGDIAFYKDAEDLQKRLAQLHAPGTRANVNATSYGDGKSPAPRVSDGKYRTIILKDFDSFKSNIIENITEVFNRRIDQAKTDAEKASLTALRDTLVAPPVYNSDGTIKKKGGKYWQINVADAQGYSSPSSYRKKALMFGKWSKEAEDIYQKLKKGEYSFTDLETAFQPLKPFVYTKLDKNMGVENAPITRMPVPFQAKNAEYLLIMADAFLKDEELSRPNLLRAIYRTMEESEEINPTMGIDTVQFESAIKSGLQTPIDLNPFLTMGNGEEFAYCHMKEAIYKETYKIERDEQTGVEKKVRTYKDYNTDSFVHETSYEDYCMQQEVPEHFMGHEQAHGSQIRMIIPSDLDIYEDGNPDNKSEDNLVKYEVVDPDGTVRMLTAQEFRDEYEETIAASIEHSIEELKKELHLVDQNGEPIRDKKEKNIALARLLQREIMSSPRYGVDLIQACSINPDTGEFRIPKGDPIQAKRIEQLINSIIKNRVNKQKIAGGPIVQVSNYGTSKQLKIRFKNKNEKGKLLMTEEEYNAYKEKHPKWEGEATYEKYIKNNQGGIAYFEVFAPYWMKDLYTYFADKDGNIDVNMIEMLDPELLKMVSYRIPTEDKYSCAPMKVVGFMPREAGDAIMFPYELTEIDDSDFDVDKRYVMRKDLPIISKIHINKKNRESYREAMAKYIGSHRAELVKELRKAVDFPRTLSDKEKAEAVEEARSVADMSKKAATRKHEEKVARIEKRYAQLDEANMQAEYSKNKEKNDAIWEKRNDRQEEKYEKLIEKEQKRYEKELAEIDQKLSETIWNSAEKVLQEKIKRQIGEFLDEGVYMNSQSDDEITGKLRKAFINLIYSVEKPTSGQRFRNNKIVDMTYTVLTHEKTADKVLNPGGFDGPKKVGYMIAAYKNPANNKSWAELQDMQIEDLKDLCYVDKDLSWTDTQVQFYKQNAAAASLIGVFAVNKVAHAVLESNGFQIDIAGICGKPFVIGNTRFNTTMEVDPRTDRQGNMIGKVLGSLVSASADAVKDPILNLMNINMTTAGMLNSMVRLGMPFEEAALFLSQDVLVRLLDEFNQRNLSDFVDLDSLVDEKIKNIEKKTGYTAFSVISKQELTTEQMVEGLRPGNHQEIDYKVLKAFQKMRSITKAMRNITYATRFNSISSAVGPLIIDNLIIEHKMEQFSEENVDDTFFMDENGNSIDIEDVFAKHPILAQFARAVFIAKDLFMDMPAGSTGFRNLLGVIPEKIRNRIFADKKLLSSLSDFYQSYLLVSEGLVDSKEADYYIEEFPKEFLEKKDSEGKTYKEKYKDNLLIQRILPETDKYSGRTHLKINITGLDETAKEAFRMAWIDLHKDNPELSAQLFNYCFFKGGIGFSPKTFMALVPAYVKERLSRTLPSGRVVKYTEIFRKLPRVDKKAVIDQFIRHNYTEGKLVPTKNEKSIEGKLHNEGKELWISDQKTKEYINEARWFKVYSNKEVHIWRYKTTIGNSMVYEQVEPLGNNGECLQMTPVNTEENFEVKTTPQETRNTDTEIAEQSQAETDAENGGREQALTDAEKARNFAMLTSWVYNRIIKGKSDFTMEDAEGKVNEIRRSIEQGSTIYRGFVTDLFAENGVTVDKKEALRKFNDMC